MKKHNLILVAFFSLTMATGCYNGHILEKPITMLANDKKTALTPPTTFDYSYKLQGPAGADPIWNFKNESTGLYSSIYWTRTANATSGYDYDTGYLNLAGFTDIEWRLRTYYTDSAMFLVGGTYYEPWYNYIGTTYNGSAVKYRFEFSNLSKYNYFLYLDFSSTGTGFFNVLYYSLNPNPPYTYVQEFGTSSIAITNHVILLPAFTVINMVHSSSIAMVKLDAIYFDKLPITQGMGGYGNENYNSGYSTGFDDGFRSVDNLEWLENVATAVKDIFSVEIFPGFTVGFIVLFPLVIAIVKWFLSLFGIGGGS